MIRFAAVLLTCCLICSGCGSDDDGDGEESGPDIVQVETDAGTIEVSTDLAVAPTVEWADAPATEALVVADVVEGDGTEAAPGDTVYVQYAGFLVDGTKFDASWDRQESFPFVLGGAQVITGWDQGVAGMKEGGRRLLVIPAEMAYGAEGTPGGPIPPDATLVFVVDLETLEPGA